MARAMPRAVQPLPLEIGVPPGRVVVRQGEPCGRPMVVARGAVYVSAVDDQGRVLGLDVVGSGDVVGEPTAGPARATARALGPCRLAPAPSADIALLVDAQAQRLLSLACQLAWLDVEGRVQHRLHDLASRFGRPVPTGTLVSLGLTQEDLAHLCGTSRESANRAIRSLVSLGRLEVRGRGRFVVPSAQPLAPSVVPPPSCSITRLHVPQ
jgi:CRP/FNR family transcriptional regulator, cyclic AMP receptor protein